MGLLDRKSLLKKNIAELVKVDLGNDDFVFVREMSAHDRDLFEQSLIKEKLDNKGNLKGYDRSMGDFRAKLAVLTVCDEAGELLLNPDDYEVLSRRMGIIQMEKIIKEAQKLNNITEQDKDNLVKNLEAAPDGNSSSGSVEN